jgi:hypothetical protein
MVLPVLMTRETRFPPVNLPFVGRMADRALDGAVSARLMQAAKGLMTGRAADQGLDLTFFPVASVTRRGHHGVRFGEPVAGDAAGRRPVARPVAEVAEDPPVLALQLPRVPRFFVRRRGSSKGRKGPALGYGVANGAGIGKGFAG